MKALLLVAGVAAAAAVVSGILLVAMPAPSFAPEGAEGSTVLAAAPTGAPRPGEIHAGPGTAELERKVRALEARLDEVLARLDAASPIPGLPGTPPPSDAPTDSAGPPDAAAKGDSPRPTTELIDALVQAQTAIPRKPDRREAEIRLRIDRAAAAMNLDGNEKARFEEMARDHLARAEEIAARARETLRNSPYGFSEADRALVGQIEGDRRSLDQRTEQSIVGLVGQDRWKQYLKTLKDQDQKEKALKRLERPW